jgi:hypothetical protein
MTKNLKKFKAEKTTIYLSLGLYKGRPSYRRSLQSSKENMKFLNFFLFLWVIFALLDQVPHSATQINADPCGSGSATLSTNVTVLFATYCVQKEAIGGQEVRVHRG